ncbi:Proline iminopeptidase, partial [Termitomyces sp. J132]
IKIIERFFDLPLNYDDPNGKKIRIFARNMVPLDKAKTPEEEAKLPYFVYLQGGPGFEVDMTGHTAMATTIHKEGYQTLWLDPRGTGLSTPFSADLVSDKSDEEIFEYLKHFRADNIVRDCEAIRKILLGDKIDEKDRKWTILGQSFGGFCCLTYLSFYPEGLKEVFIAGGIPPLVNSPEIVYGALAKRVLARNDVYYNKYPNDVKRVRDILAYLDKNSVILPNGGKLTPNRFLQLGIAFGSQESEDGIDTVHQLVLRASNDISLFGKLSQRLLQNVEHDQTLDGNPLYAILHEPIYCQGRASNWSAERILKDYPQHSWNHMKTQDNQSPVCFFGEMIFSDMLDDYIGLRPLKGAAQLLAKFSDWPPLYDEAQLAKNTVKVTAATYYKDMYVDFNLAQITASAVQNMEQYISNQHHHSALRRETELILKKLFQLSKREYD